jgi:phosphoribosylformylglycinamidine synthase
MSEACRALSIPVIGGNVSLYNESRGRDIDPTPVVGTLGLVDRLERRPPGARLVEGSAVVVVGAVGDLARSSSLAGSRWAVDIRGHRGGRLPALDLALHLRLVRLVEDLVWSGLVDGVHDVSEGGVGVTLAEMAVAGGVGFTVEHVADHAALFGEEPSRVVFSVPGPGLDELEGRVRSAGLGLVRMGVAGGDRLVVAGLMDVSLADAEAAWRGSLPAALGVS